MATSDDGTDRPGAWRAVSPDVPGPGETDAPSAHDGAHGPAAGSSAGAAGSGTGRGPQQDPAGRRGADDDSAATGHPAGDAWRPVRPVVALEQGAVPKRTQNGLRVLFVAVIVSSLFSFVQAWDAFLLAIEFENAMKETFFGDVQYPEEAIIRDGIRMYSGLTTILAMVLLMAMVVLPVRYGMLFFGVGRNVPGQYRRMISWAKILVVVEAVRLSTLGMMALEEYEVASLSVGFSWNLPLGIGIWWYLRRDHVMDAYQVPIYVLPGGERERNSI